MYWFHLKKNLNFKMRFKKILSVKIDIEKVVSAVFDRQIFVYMYNIHFPP